MAETIINSNQVRASGDTSTQTLIGANQIRQSGDSSSQTLLNKNQIASGGGVEFKTSIYSQDNAYINTGIANTNIYGLRVKGSVRVNSYTGHQQQIICGYIDYSSSGANISCFVNSTIGGSVPTNYREVKISIKEGNTERDNIQIANNSGIIMVNTFDLKFIDTTNTGTKEQFEYKIFTGNRANQGGSFIEFTNGVVALEIVELYDISGNMIAELKPAIVNGESGMYDTITETFYGNANSVGSLVCE